MAETAVAAAERTLPHNLEAERSVLGAILVHNDAFNLAAQVITPADFYRDAHRRIFDKMIALNERNQAIDFVTLKEELSRAGELDEVGGPAYIASLADGVPRATNVEYYARIVKEKATLRNLIYAANKILTNAYEADQESDLILDEAESAIFSVADDRLKAGFVPMRDLVKESFPKIEQLFEQKRLITGVPTGFVDLDEMTRGFQAGDLIIIAARPSMGKTSLVLNIVAVRGDAAGSHRRVLQPGNVEGVAVPPPADLGGADRQPPADERRDRAEGLRPHLARARDAERDAAVHRRHGEHRRAGDARQGAAAAGRARAQPDRRRLHPADERPRPVREPHAGARVDLALAQGAGQGAERADRRPVAARRARRRRGRIIGRSSRICASRAPSSRTPTSSSLIYREDVYNRDPNNPDAGTAELIVAKQRNGPTGVVRLAFLREQTRFANLAQGA